MTDEEMKERIESLETAINRDFWAIMLLFASQLGTMYVILKIWPE